MTDTNDNNDNYFDYENANYVHDAWMMVVSDDTDYDDIRDVLVNETTFTEDDLDRMAERLTE